MRFRRRRDPSPRGRWWKRTRCSRTRVARRRRLLGSAPYRGAALVRSTGPRHPATPDSTPATARSSTATRRLSIATSPFATRLSSAFSSDPSPHWRTVSEYYNIYVLISSRFEDLYTNTTLLLASTWICDLCLGNLKIPSASVIIRGPFGRHAWTMQMRLLPLTREVPQLQVNTIYLLIYSMCKL